MGVNFQNLPKTWLVVMQKKNYVFWHHNLQLRNLKLVVGSISLVTSQMKYENGIKMVFIQRQDKLAQFRSPKIFNELYTGFFI